jgi:hypothetical protein
MEQTKFTAEEYQKLKETIGPIRDYLDVVVQLLIGKRR